MKKTEYDRLYAKLLKEFNDEKDNLMFVLRGEHAEEAIFLDKCLRNTQYTFQRLVALKSIESYV